MKWRTSLASKVTLQIRSNVPLADITVISHFPAVCPWLHRESHTKVALLLPHGSFTHKGLH